MSGTVKQGSLRHRVPGNADYGSEERNNHKTINKSKEGKEVKIKEFSITPEFRRTREPENQRTREPENRRTGEPENWRIGELEYRSSGVPEFRKSGETNK